MSMSKQRIATLSGLGGIGMFVGLNLFNSLAKHKGHSHWHNHWSRYKKSGGKQSVPWDGNTNSIACKYLDEILTTIVESSTNNTTIKIFVPLCGSSQDMIEIYNRLSTLIESDKKRNIGFKIFGIDLSEIAIKAFFTDKMKISLQNENLKITNNRKTRKNFVQYEYYNENDNGYCLFVGDLFNSNMIDEIGGKNSVDLILDVNSLIALNISQRNDYIDLCVNLLKQNGQILLQTYWYDPNARQDSPWPFNKQLVEKYYGPRGLKVQSLVNPAISFEMYDFFKDKLKAFNIQEGWVHVWLLQYN